MLIPLDTDWTLTLRDGAVPANLRDVPVRAQVPGCVHTDLLAAGLIPDPYLDRNEEELAWIGRSTARYATRLDLDPPAPGERVELVFQGVDTIADIGLGDRRLGSVANQHRSYRFDVTEALAAGPHELWVDFAAQLDETEARSAALGPRPHTNVHPYNAVRKMACNYLWDWGPDLVTAGLWRPVLVHRWAVARFAQVVPRVTVEGTDGVVVVRARVQRAAAPPASRPLTVRVSVGGVSASAPVGPDDAAEVAVRIPDVRRWWPRGYGAQELYAVVVELLDNHDVRRDDPDGHDELLDGHAVLERREHRVGFRTVELDTAPDADGAPMAFRINGRPVFIRGANWIPDDCFPSRVDARRYAARIAQAVDANVNLLRVWGGGIYESDEFYAACAEAGVLTWQDFLFACAAYAEEEPLRGEVLAEAAENIPRLAWHPSLVLWNGNNENLWGHEDWGWREPLAGRTWGAGYYHNLLPALLADLDPTRPYTPGSPFSPASEAPARHPNDPAYGSMHVWDVWNERDYRCYRDYRARFVAEFGYQGPPTWATLTRALHDVPLSPTSPGMLAHQKAPDGNGKLTRGIAGHLPLPQDPVAGFEDWHWAMQLQQAHAVGFGIEHFRSLAPLNAGTIVWQLNDCWPVTSWAMVDGDGRLKPVWYAVRAAYAPRLLTIQPRDGGLAVIAANDTDAAWALAIQVRRAGFDGTELATQRIAVTVPPRATAPVPLDAALCSPGDPRGEILVADADGAGERATWFFAPDLELRLSAAPVRVVVQAGPDGVDVHLQAVALAKDVTLLADKVAPDAVADAALLTLLPGETRTIHVGGVVADPQALLGPRVLRSANDLVAPRREDS